MFCTPKFFSSFPFLRIGIGIFHSRSHSQKLAMLFFNPVPKLWEWAIPLPKVQKPFPFIPEVRHTNMFS